MPERRPLRADREMKQVSELDALLDEARMTRGRLLRTGLAAGAVTLSGSEAVADAATRRTREHWIAAVPTTWNVVPNGRNAIEEVDYPPERTVFPTVVYRAFTRNWRRQLASPEPNGILVR